MSTEIDLNQPPHTFVGEAPFGEAIEFVVRHAGDEKRLTVGFSAGAGADVATFKGAQWTDQLTLSGFDAGGATGRILLGAVGRQRVYFECQCPPADLPDRKLEYKFSRGSTEHYLLETPETAELRTNQQGQVAVISGLRPDGSEVTFGFPLSNARSALTGMYQALPSEEQALAVLSMLANTPVKQPTHGGETRVMTIRANSVDLATGWGGQRSIVFGFETGGSIALELTDDLLAKLADHLAEPPPEPASDVRGLN